ncbi:unnamed protein product [Urochloa decumbens]|uniref:F-box domain-containing protein n=1 Tax=Urochloa decumbens TaxID=240449 RepID=A0ABC9F7Q5_9POAL
MTRKRTNRSRICGEVFVLVFSRLPARDAVRCAALSRHHRRLVGSLDFWLLHRRLAPPVPHPHIAYMASSTLPGRLFHEFLHLAAGSNNGLRRALIDRDPAYSCRRRYAGTCNGVVVLAAESFHSSTTVVLFNPAVAGSEEVVGINLNNAFGPGPYRVSGFGYGASTGRHRLLVTRVHEKGRHGGASRYNDGAAAHMLSYTLGRDFPDGVGRCRAVLSSSKSGPRTKISGSSVYLDGKVYLLADHARVLAFDVDDETVAAIDLPGERAPEPEEKHARSKLMEMSGRLCVATAGGEGNIALWLLTADQQWERRCLIPRYAAGKLAGGWEWDCGGALLLLFTDSAKEPDLILYDTRVNNKASAEPLHVPRAVAEPEEREASRHVFCWGYRPTLVSPGSILGGGARPILRRGGGVATALNPVLERDVRAGRRRTMETVCFMDMLFHIMQQLPDKADEVVMEFSLGSLPFSLR